MSGIADQLAGMRRFLRGRAGRCVLRNAAALSIAQAATYILPLIVLPYTAMVLGPRNFGLVALTQAAVQYSTLITNFGFSYAATREAALSHARNERLADIVIHVWAAKALLMLVCLAASIACFAVFPSLRPELGAYLCGFLAVVGNVFYLDWFFQAIEEMKWITIANVVPKLILTPLIFVFVKRPRDYVFVILIQSLAYLVSGIACAILAWRRLGFPRTRPNVGGILAQYRSGWRTFAASVCTNFYTATNTVLLGLLTNATVVGYYSAAQRLIAGIQSLLSPVSQALYPHFCKTFQADPHRASAQLKRVLAAVFYVTLLGACVASLVAPRVVPLYFGPRFANSVAVIRVLVFSVWAVAINTVLGLQGLIAAGLHTSFLRVVGGAALVNLAVAPVAIHAGSGIGLAMFTVLLEIAIAVIEYRILRGKAVL